MSTVQTQTRGERFKRLFVSDKRPSVRVPDFEEHYGEAV